MAGLLSQWIKESEKFEMQRSYRVLDQDNYAFLNRQADFYITLLNKMFFLLEEVEDGNYAAKTQELLEIAKGLAIYSDRDTQDMFEHIDKKGISKCKENIDWEQTCRKCYPKILDLTKTKLAFKDLFYLIAMNNGDDTEELIAESTLSAYGWHLIVKAMVELYEEILCTNTEYADHISAKEELSMEIEKVSESSETPTENAETVEEPKEVITVSKGEKCSEVQEELSSVKQEVSTKKKYVRGRPIVLKCLTDGKEMEWTTAKAIEDSLGIPKGAIRKNVSGHSKYIRHNNIKYQAFYKEVC